MGSDSDQIRDDINAKQEEILGTVMEIGDRLAVPRTTFLVGIFTGIFLLTLINRIQFRRVK